MDSEKPIRQAFLIILVTIYSQRRLGSKDIVRSLCIIVVTLYRHRILGTGLIAANSLHQRHARSGLAALIMLYHHRDLIRLKTLESHFATLTLWATSRLLESKIIEAQCCDRKELWRFLELLKLQSLLLPGRYCHKAKGTQITRHEMSN